MINAAADSGSLVWRCAQPSRPYHSGDGSLDIAISTYTHGETLETGHRYCKQLRDIGSDHMPWILRLPIRTNNQSEMRRNFNKFDKERFRNLTRELVGSFKEITTDEECEAVIIHLERTINNALDECAPYTYFNKNDALPENVLALIKTRNRARRTMARYRIPGIATLYNRLRAEASDALWEWREKQWLMSIDDNKNNRANMWRIQKALKKPEPQLPCLDGLTDERAIVNRLVDVALVKDTHVAVEDCEELITTPFSPLKPSNLIEINLAIRSFKPNKAPGPDGIMLKGIKYAALEMKRLLLEVVNWTLKTGYYPQRWKMGDCIFIHKSGKDHHQERSFRPITLLNIMGKIAERIIYYGIQSTVRDKIPESQHGFMNGRGTDTQLARTTNYIAKAMNNKEHCAMIITDLSKAFDSIHHKALIKKMVTMDFPSNIIKLIENYLANRTVRGKFRTTLGDHKLVINGVPQGSVLGPIIFNIYVADINIRRESGLMVSQYADDLCVLNSAERPDCATRKLEWAARDLLAYYDRWGLKCNRTKTECIMFTRSFKYRKTINIDGENVTYKNQAKYLGVILDKRLSMNLHTQATINKGNAISKLLDPIIGYRSKASIETKLTVIKACLLPVLDYGTVQLLPRYSATNIKKIEVVYKKALKRAAELPMSIPTDTLWEMLDEDPYHVRAVDLHNDMLERVKSRQIKDIQERGPVYDQHGQFNILRPSTRLGELPAIAPKLRKIPVSKRPVEFRHRGTIH